MRLQIHTGIPDVSLDAVVPEYTRAKKAQGLSEKEYYGKKGLPVLWLLHGAFGSSGDWMRYSQIELFAKISIIALAVPELMYLIQVIENFF